MSEVSDTISELLKQANSKVESKDLINADIQKVKSEIHAAFSNQQHQLQLREQWLLDQVDHILECLSGVSQKHYEKVAEVKGKLLCCVEVSKLPQLKDCKNFEKLVSNLVNSFQSLTKQDLDGFSSITFEADEIGMSNMIRRFGSVSSHAIHGDDTSSVCSWDMGESDTDSGVTKQVQDFVMCSKTCGGGSCQRPGIAIEDLNEFFSEEMMQPAIDDVCKANETCASFADCLCDESCLTSAQSGNDRPQSYVTAIGNAFDAIISGKDAYSNPIPTNIEDHVKAQEKFDEQILSLEVQFNQIISGTYTPADVSASCNTKEPWSANCLEREINIILHREGETALTTSTKDTTPVPQPLLALDQQIVSILNGEMPMFGVKDDVSCPEPTPNLNQQFDSLSDHMKLMLTPPETECTEKMDYEKDRAFGGSKKWTTVHELDSIIAGILE